jgi:hypothetical protein
MVDAVPGGGDREPDARLVVPRLGYPVLWGISWRARSASWIARHRGLLRRAITDVSP